MAELGRLGPEELSRRIAAARTLAGLNQRELRELLHKDGLDKHEATRLERGVLPLTRVRLNALTDRLPVPSAWFTEPDLGRLFITADQAADVEGVIEEIEDLDASPETERAAGESRASGIEGAGD